MRVSNATLQVAEIGQSGIFWTQKPSTNIRDINLHHPNVSRMKEENLGKLHFSTLHLHCESIVSIPNVERFRESGNFYFYDSIPAFVWGMAMKISYRCIKKQKL